MIAIDALLAGPLSAVTVAGTVFAGLGAVCAKLWLGETAPGPDARKQHPPVTLLRPIKPGAPGLREKVETLAAALRPGDQLILGADENSPELAVCQAARTAFPDRGIVAVSCRAGAVANPKISKLVQMETHVKNEHLILSDCEMRMDAEWLDAFRREWAETGADVLTAPYRFVGQKTLPEHADAAVAVMSLWPGLALVRALGKPRFTLGACTALRAADVAEAGGWKAFGDDLAEDNRLGAALAGRAKSIRLSTQVATLESDPLSWQDFWRHQRRVAVTYRVSNPAGFAGMVATHSVTAGVLMILLAPLSAAPGFWFLWGAGSVILRGLLAIATARWARFPVPQIWKAMVPAAVAETACWAASWVSPVVWWSGRWLRVRRDGKIGAAAIS